MRVKRRVDIVRFLSAAPITKRANDKSEGQKRGEDKVREKNSLETDESANLVRLEN